jgi:hypothetical protein
MSGVGCRSDSLYLMRHAFRCEYNQQNRDGDARLHQKRRPSRSQRAKESKNLVASKIMEKERRDAPTPHGSWRTRRYHTRRRSQCARRAGDRTQFKMSTGRHDRPIAGRLIYNFLSVFFFECGAINSAEAAVFQDQSKRCLTAYLQYLPAFLGSNCSRDLTDKCRSFDLSMI